MFLRQLVAAADTITKWHRLTLQDVWRGCPSHQVQVRFVLVHILETYEGWVVYRAEDVDFSFQQNQARHLQTVGLVSIL